MKDQLKIAVYSGDIPSTTFIERLIQGLSHTGNRIYLFGFIKKKTRYPALVSVFGYKNTRVHKALHYIKYSFLLFCFKNKEKQKLDGILKAQSKNLLLDKVKSYPVLWHKPDVFHVQWAKGLADWVWVQEFGIKLVLSLRGAHINYSPIADQALASSYREHFPKVDAFHAVSKAIGVEAEKYGAATEKIHVVYSGLPQGKAHVEKQKTKTVLQMISVGRAHWKKGYTYALDACKILKAQGVKFHYTIVGGTNDIEFAYQLHDLHLEKEVSLIDNLPYAKVQALMQQADLLVLPSVEEGIANVVLEAMQNKTLVLSTNCGGMDEVIADGVNGFMVPIRNAKAIATKIVEIVAIPEVEKEAIRKKAVRTINTQHSEEQMVNQMLAVYQSLYHDKA
ncbi:glycosyltransferase family 4 protein [Lacinutrix sp. C3R15]|uniref:glycosyltransferase family 4 protein n=1 Tax=Flavobacteriaceae TaxID=49546 RepID=UPI001C09161B|nr:MULTISPECIES: glycosyltransferase family 4 protein [Flavobacteriaceae]MBU2939582.1 glycosyltransferase family 4 protein [Lacinutrix sp. C3R15]MDO6622896.1 glycosyltransferase family 4 protein [Oceanihabitans sp. 1_MG-2023]